MDKTKDKRGMIMHNYYDNLQDDRINITGRRIKSLRLSRDLTQTELGECINLKKSAISRYENGSAKPGREALKKIGDFFNVSVDYLLGNIDTFHHVESANMELYEKLFNAIMNKPKEEQERIIYLLSELLK